jgi:hypothetical protein
MAFYEDDNFTLCVPRPSSGQSPDQSIVVRAAVPRNLPLNHVLIKVDRFGFSANKCVQILWFSVVVHGLIWSA